MRRHAEAGVASLVLVVADWLELLLLGMDAAAAAPPPRLMHERPMRRIHQPDDAMIDVAGQVRRDVCRAVARRELRDLRHWRKLSTAAARARLRKINPGVAVALLAWIRRGINLCRVQRVGFGERGDQLALAAARVELPAVIFAGYGFAVEPSGRERNSAMRTQVAHGEDGSSCAPPQQQWMSQQQRCLCLSRGKLTRPDRRIPVAEEKLCRWA